MSALRYKKLPPEDRDWEIFDRMKRGEKRFAELKTAIDQVDEDLNNHIEDPNPHPGLALPDPWYHDRRKQTAAGGGIVALVLTILVAIEQYLA